jgi:predicted nucleotidyltransferase
MRFVRRAADEPTAVDPATVRESLRPFPVSLAVLFGSHAKGTEHTLSDLDVAVLFRDNINGKDRIRLLDAITTAIIESTGIDAVDLVDLERTSADLGYDIMTHGVLLLGDRTDAVELETTFLSKKFDFKPVKEEWQTALSNRISEGEYGRS